MFVFQVIVVKLARLVAEFAQGLIMTYILAECRLVMCFGDIHATTAAIWNDCYDGLEKMRLYSSFSEKLAQCCD